MNRPQLLNQSLASLVKAYLQDTLDRMDCAACACGNILAGHYGYQVVSNPHEELGDNHIWLENGEEVNLASQGLCISNYAFWRSPDKLNQGPQPSPYTFDEIKKIEVAFMWPEKFGFEFGNYGGLLSACEALLKIHEAQDSDLLEVFTACLEDRIPYEVA